MVCLSVAERSRLPPGPVLGGGPHGGLLLHGPALVRGRHRHLHRTHRQSEDGNGDVGSRGAAQVLGREVRPQPRARFSALFSSGQTFLYFWFSRLFLDAPQRRLMCQL